MGRDAGNPPGTAAKPSGPPAGSSVIEPRTAPGNAPGALQAHAAEMPEDPRAALVRQVLASRTFAKSARLSQFFEFICRKCLEGAPQEINEQQIGVHVFGRSPAYNAADDSIVRTQARLLRQRLEEYFEHECPGCPTIILIPKGGYVPVFERRPESPVGYLAVYGGEAETIGLPAEATALSPATPEQAPRLVPQAAQTGDLPSLQPAALRSRRLGWPVAAGAAFLLLALLVAAALSFRPSAPAPSAGATLWGSLFTSSRPVVIVPSDDGLVLLEELRRAPVTLGDYLSGSYLRQGGGAPVEGGPLTAGWLSSHQYTSTADLNLAMRLNRLPEAASAHVETRYARLLRLDDLKSNNIILIGGIGANPWVGLFSRELNFDVNYDWKMAQGYVINKHPQSGEQARYLEDHGDHSARSYGVLAYLPGIAGQGSALLFEGSGMAGTEAAADFPFSGEGFARMLDQLRAAAAEAASSPTRGSIPYFEVLLETQSLGGNGPEAQVLAWRLVRR